MVAINRLEPVKNFYLQGMLEKKVIFIGNDALKDRKDILELRKRKYYGITTLPCFSDGKAEEKKLLAPYRGYDEPSKR